MAGNPKICNFCKTTENLVVDKLKRIHSICYDCSSEKAKERNQSLHGDKLWYSIEDKKTYLVENYINQNKSTFMIAEELGVAVSSVKRKLSKYKIRKSKKKWGEICKITRKRSPEKEAESNRKIVETKTKKYGKDFRKQEGQKIQKVLLDKYGTHPLNIEEFKLKRKKSCLIKYGTEHVLQNEKVKAKGRRTNIKKYGVENPAKNLSVIAKIHSSKKKNKSYGKSKSEDACYEYILENLDFQAERQVKAGKWSIDFYLPKYDMFVQFDGDYYHGYFINEKNKSTHTKSILFTMKNDKMQNATMSNLVRIRESEFKKNPKILDWRIDSKTHETVNRLGEVV